MAQLERVTNLRDSQNSWQFTFTVEAELLEEEQVAGKQAAGDILSRELQYGGLRWQLRLSQKDGTHLSPYIEVCRPSATLSCLVDYQFCLINWESFTQNELFVDAQRRFSADEPCHGKRTFVSLSELTSRRGFLHPCQRRLLLQLTLRRANVFVDAPFLLLLPAADPNQRRDSIDCRRYDGEPFRYGEYDWQASFCPNMEGEVGVGRRRHLFQLEQVNRKQGESMCRLSYRFQIGSADTSNYWQSATRHDLFDYSGSSNSGGLYIADDYTTFVDAAEQTLTLRIQLFSLVNVSHVKWSPVHQRGVQLVDNDRQMWNFSADLSAERLAALLFYSGMANIPNGYLRYVSWNCTILPAEAAYQGDDSAKKDEQVLGCPLEEYFSNQSIGSQMKYRMLTTIPSSELTSSSGSIWMSKADKKVTFEVEWLASYLLSRPLYSITDDIWRRHLAQMRREVDALQSENYMLEKELHNYQHCIASKCSSSTTSASSPPSAAFVVVTSAAGEPQPPTTGRKNDENNRRAVPLDGGRSPPIVSRHLSFREKRTNHETYEQKGGRQDESSGRSRATRSGDGFLTVDWDRDDGNEQRLDLSRRRRSTQADDVFHLAEICSSAKRTGAHRSASVRHSPHKQREKQQAPRGQQREHRLTDGGGDDARFERGGRPLYGTLRRERSDNGRLSYSNQGNLR